MEIPVIKVDTTEIDNATLKVQKLILEVEKLYELCEKSWLLKFILGIRK